MINFDIIEGKRNNPNSGMFHLVTNFKISDEALYQEAIRESGMSEILFITKNDAVDINEKRLDSYYSLRYSTDKLPNLSNFWEVYDRLSKERISLNLFTVQGLFMRAKAEGKLDQFTDQFWNAFSHNTSLTYKEAEKILESI